MDSQQYKMKSAQPNAFSREQLEKTIQLVQVDDSIKGLIENLLKTSPLEKPAHYSGVKKDDIFLVSVPKHVVNTIVQRLGEREAEFAESKTPNQQRLSETADLLDKWNHLSMNLA
jgi:hypothetical protein